MQMTRWRCLGDVPFSLHQGRYPKLPQPAKFHHRHRIPGGKQRAHFSDLKSTTPVSNISETLKNDGYAVLRNLFSSEQMHKLNSEMDDVLSRIKPGKTASMVEGSAIPGDEATQAAVFGCNTKRVDRLISHSNTWRTLADDQTMHDICAKVFEPTGDYWLSTAQMIEIGPGSAETPLHPDAGLWWLLLGLNDATAPELVINFLVATTPTTINNGATGVVEGSHKLPTSQTLVNPGGDIWKTPTEEVKQIELDTGDCLLIGGRIFHRGGANQTKDEFRRILSIMVTSCTLTPEEAHPLYIDAESASHLGTRARKFFGYESLRPVLGAGFWRV